MIQIKDNREIINYKKFLLSELKKKKESVKKSNDKREKVISDKMTKIRNDIAKIEIEEMEKKNKDKK